MWPPQPLILPQKVGTEAARGDRQKAGEEAGVLENLFHCKIVCHGACVCVPEVPAVIPAKTMLIHSCDAVENVEETTKPKEDRVESMSGPMGLRSDV